MRKTKIICTLGPASADRAILRKLMLAGMDVARFNFSHGSHESHLETYNNLLELREELNSPIATLLDTKGPEIRVGRIQNGAAELKQGQIFTLAADGREGNQQGAAISYAGLVEDIHPGAVILLDDGLIKLTVQEISGQAICCLVDNKGTLKSGKGVNIPGVALSLPFISEKDRADIIFGIKHGFDFIAASFTRSAADILELRQILNEYHCDTINIIAKIENMQGVNNIDEILQVADGVMIARGDLGVEIPLEEVPVVQKMIIKKVYSSGKQVITATQMLDSMCQNPRPTRAEATDVANAIYDNTSAIMLSGETASGLYPVEALETMVKIAMRTEADIDYVERYKSRVNRTANMDVTDAISHATCTTAHDLGAAAIIAVTKSGRTARMIAKYRPGPIIIGCGIHPHACRQMNLIWGVKPILIEEKSTTDELFRAAVDGAVRQNLIQPEDLTVITAGVPLGTSGTTNMIRVYVAEHD